MTNISKICRGNVVCAHVWQQLNQRTSFMRNNFTGNMAKEFDKVVCLSAADSVRLSGWREEIKSARECLKNNGIIAVPTDTIYGVAALAQSTNAVNKIYDIKNRDTIKPIAICVGDVHAVSKWAKVTVSHQLLGELLPGPVTTVFERTVALNPSLNPGTSLVGVRVPDYGFVREVARECNEPLALTSANISSSQSTVNIHEFSELWPSLDLIFDGGVLGTSAQARLGSTVVDLSKTGCFTIIRRGSAYKQTKQCLERYGLEEEEKL